MVRKPREIPKPGLNSGLAPKVESLTGVESVANAEVQLVRVPLKNLGYDPENFREEGWETSPRTLDIIASLDAIKQLEPAAITPRETYLKVFPQHAETITTDYVVISGNRRRYGAEHLGWEDLECIIRRSVNEDLDQLVDRIYAWNVQREGINPLREAHHLAGLMKRFGNSQRKVAQHIGKSQPYVQQRLSLLKLVPELQALVTSEAVGAKAGRLLATISKSEQNALLAKSQKVPEDAASSWWIRSAEAAVAARQKADTTKADDTKVDNPAIAPASKASRGKRDNPVITGGSAHSITMPLGDPRLIADTLQQSLTPDAFSELVDVLLERVEH